MGEYKVSVYLYVEASSPEDAEQQVEDELEVLLGMSRVIEGHWVNYGKAEEVGEDD